MERVHGGTRVPCSRTGSSRHDTMLERLLDFLLRRNKVIELLLLSLGGSLLVVSVLVHWHTQKRYASTWTFTETRSEVAAGGPYREGELTVASLVPRDAPVIAQIASFSGHALSLYMSVFLPFFLPIVFDFSTAASLCVMVIAVGVATRRSALRILDGSALPGATSTVVPGVLLMTGGIVFVLWSSSLHPVPLQIGLFHVVLPIWAAVQAALILASARVERPIAQARDGLGQQEERSKFLDWLRSGWD